MLPPPDLDALVERYCKPGPRYTSYPTAPHFRDDFGARAYRHELAASNLSGHELSLYLHLPFCPHLCFYCGCHTVITKKRDRITRYLLALKHEIDLVASLVTSDRVVRQLHWGGGTPTYLLPDEIRDLMHHLRDRFHVAADAEVGIEADPRGLTTEHLASAREAGFNRISFGVQDLDPRVQATIGRMQPVEAVARAVHESRRLGFGSVSLDLMYGLPFQTEPSYAATLDHVLALAPDRLSVFSYAHVPWMKKHQRVIPTDALPDPVDKLRMFFGITARLTAAGYRHVGMDHFARPEDALCRAQDAGTLHRNFQGYSTHAGLDVLAFGASGIGQLERAYVQNQKDLSPYEATVAAGDLPIVKGRLLSDEDVVRRAIITRLMCDFELDFESLGGLGAAGFRHRFAPALEALRPLEADGLVHLAPQRLRVTDLGRFFVRNVAAAFDAYLRPAAPADVPRYSLTI